ncbi:hypothetical protein DIPPA_22869 [Diplonema papillatum]|nr:hypothetical protein DIPPA_22869 [Diplonema papillatum]
MRRVETYVHVRPFSEHEVDACTRLRLPLDSSIWAARAGGPSLPAVEAWAADDASIGEMLRGRAGQGYAVAADARAGNRPAVKHGSVFTDCFAGAGGGAAAANIAETALRDFLSGRDVCVAALGPKGGGKTRLLTGDAEGEGAPSDSVLSHFVEDMWEAFGGEDCDDANDVLVSAVEILPNGLAINLLGDGEDYAQCLGETFEGPIPGWNPLWEVVVSVSRTLDNLRRNSTPRGTTVISLRVDRKDASNKQNSPICMFAEIEPLAQHATSLTGKALRKLAQTLGGGASVLATGSPASDDSVDLTKPGALPWAVAWLLESIQGRAWSTKLVACVSPSPTALQASAAVLSLTRTFQQPSPAARPEPKQPLEPAAAPAAGATPRTSPESDAGGAVLRNESADHSGGGGEEAGGGVIQVPSKSDPRRLLSSPAVAAAAPEVRFGDAPSRCCEEPGGTGAAAFVTPTRDVAEALDFTNAGDNRSESNDGGGASSERSNPLCRLAGDKPGGSPAGALPEPRVAAPPQPTPLQGGGVGSTPGTVLTNGSPRIDDAVCTELIGLVKMLKGEVETLRSELADEREKRQASALQNEAGEKRTGAFLSERDELSRALRLKSDEVAQLTRDKLAAESRLKRKSDEASALLFGQRQLQRELSTSTVRHSHFGDAAAAAKLPSPRVDVRRTRVAGVSASRPGYQSAAAGPYMRQPSMTQVLQTVGGSAVRSTSHSSRAARRGGGGGGGGGGGAKPKRCSSTAAGAPGSKPAQPGQPRGRRPSVPAAARTPVPRVPSLASDAAAGAAASASGVSGSNSSSSLHNSKVLPGYGVRHTRNALSGSHAKPRLPMPAKGVLHFRPQGVLTTL